MQDIVSGDLDALSQQYYAGQISLNTEAERYTREEMAAFYGDSMERLAVLVEAMTPAQLAYRLPGTPEGADASGDEAHFDTSELVTHLATGTAFHWWGITRALRDERPTFPRPPEGTPTTGKAASGFGRGGWSGLSAGELAQMVRDTSNSFLTYIAALPEDANMNATARYTGFGELTAQAWLFLAALHSYAHLKQLREMQARPDYPAG